MAKLQLIYKLKIIAIKIGMNFFSKIEKKIPKDDKEVYIILDRKCVGDVLVNCLLSSENMLEQFQFQESVYLGRGHGGRSER